MNKIIGFIIVGVGLSLLVAVFALSVIFLFTSVKVPNATDAAQAIAVSIPPLIESCLKAIFLSIMCWVGSIVLSRGISMLRGSDGGKESGGQHAREAGEDSK